MDVPRYTYTSASNKISVIDSELNTKKQQFERVYQQFLSKYSKYGKYKHEFKARPIQPFVL